MFVFHNYLPKKKKVLYQNRFKLFNRKYHLLQIIINSNQIKLSSIQLIINNNRELIYKKIKILKMKNTNNFYQLKPNYKKIIVFFHKSRHKIKVIKVIFRKKMLKNNFLKVL